VRYRRPPEQDVSVTEKSLFSRSMTPSASAMKKEAKLHCRASRRRCNFLRANCVFTS
jgi:hypothetical protein